LFWVPKRHQMKHLDFDLLWFGTRGSEVQILSPRPFNQGPARTDGVTERSGDIGTNLTTSSRTVVERLQNPSLEIEVTNSFTLFAHLRVHFQSLHRLAGLFAKDQIDSRKELFQLRPWQLTDAFTQKGLVEGNDLRNVSNGIFR
jgi:hypothetical protein